MPFHLNLNPVQWFVVAIDTLPPKNKGVAFYVKKQQNIEAKRVHDSKFIIYTQQISSSNSHIILLKYSWEITGLLSLNIKHDSKH